MTSCKLRFAGLELSQVRGKNPGLSFDPRAAALQVRGEMPRSVAERIAQMSDQNPDDEESSD